MSQKVGKQAKLIVFRAKLVSLFDQGTSGMGQLDLRQERALLVLVMLFLLCPGKEFNL